MSHFRATQVSSPTRVLLVCGAMPDNGTCPDESAQSARLTHIARETLETIGIECDVLDLSLVTSECPLHLHPGKDCMSTAMPPGNGPCSCHPQHGLGQTPDRMATIRERWTAAHAVLIITPAHWCQSPGPLKRMIDRLACNDRGEQAASDKALEQTACGRPKHLAGQAYGVVVHGDPAAIEVSRRSLCDWLDWMGFIEAGAVARLDQCIDGNESHTSGRRVLDRALDEQEETRQAAQSIAQAVAELRGGWLKSLQSECPRPG